jgi:hypothetical protein
MAITLYPGIDETTVFARCAVCVRRVRSVCGVCGRVRCCAVLKSLPSQIGATSKLTKSVELANDVGGPCKPTPLLTCSAT